ncbi:hypothetical protein DITRI_Ditri08aG0095400 [Diplodiscus trichospermus]
MGKEPCLCGSSSFREGNPINLAHKIAKLDRKNDMFNVWEDSLRPNLLLIYFANCRSVVVSKTCGKIDLVVYRIWLCPYPYEGMLLSLAPEERKERKGLGSSESEKWLWIAYWRHLLMFFGPHEQ